MSQQYDASPNRLEELLTIEELRSILESDLKWMGKDSSRIFHMVSRMGRTLLAYRQQIQQLHRDVQQMNLSRAQVGTPSTLSPIDAVRYLTPEQLAGVVDSASRNVIEAAARQRKEAKAATADAIRCVHEVNLVVGALCDDVTIPPAVRDRLQLLMENLATSTPHAVQEQLDGLFEDGADGGE